MNQDSVDSELQKAIDDITKNTNADPVFADAVAAPAVVELEAAVVTESRPAPIVPAVPPEPRKTSTIGRLVSRPVTPARPVAATARPSAMNARPAVVSARPIASARPVTMAARPAAVTPTMAPATAPMAPPAPAPSQSAVKMATPSVVPPMPSEAEMIIEDTPAGNENVTEETTMNTDMGKLKEAMLRDLVPIVDKLDMTPNQKFGIYRDAVDNLQDLTVIEPAYHAAAEIADDKERGEALLYLMETIDNAR